MIVIHHPSSDRAIRFNFTGFEFHSWMRLLPKENNNNNDDSGTESILVATAGVLVAFAFAEGRVARDQWCYY